MSDGNLRYTLVVRHPETAAPTALLAGEPVPGWASELVQPDDMDGPKPAKKASTATKRPE